MKTTRTIILAALAIVGCAKEPAGSGSQTQQKEISGAFTLKVQTSVPESKTAISDAFETTWVAEDEISVFHAEAGNSEIKSDGAFGFDADNNFSGQIAGSLVVGKTYDWYTFYPHSEEFASPAQIGVTVPASVAAAGAGVSHLTGDNAPLYGKIAEVAADQTPSVTMHHLLSVLEVVVHNNTLMPMDVNSITIEAAENIAGDFNVDITSGSPVFTATTGSKSVTLSLSAPVSIKASESEKFYFGIKPFTAAKGSTLTLKVNDDVKSLTLAEAVTFTGGKIKTLNYNSNGPAFTVNAQGKKVVFSVGNLWYGHEASNREFKIETVQNKALNPETDWDGVVFNGEYIQHFIWSEDRYVAYDILAPDVTFETTDRLFAADGGAIEGWTVLTKDEWNYLLNERTVNGGKGAGYSYFNTGYNKAGYKADGKTLKGCFIFPDSYNGALNIGGSNKTYTWDEINSVGVAYLPSAGGYSKRLTDSDDGWISTSGFAGAYLGSDIFTNSNNVNTFCTVKWNESNNQITINTAPTINYGYTIRLVKVVE